MAKLPILCPSCSNGLAVAQMHCTNCGTTVNGDYSLPMFLHLSPDEQDFVMQFLINSGSLKEMAKQMKISYPTVRNKLDDLIATIKKLQSEDENTAL